MDISMLANQQELTYISFEEILFYYIRENTNNLQAFIWFQVSNNNNSY